MEREPKPPTTSVRGIARAAVRSIRARLTRDAAAAQAADDALHRSLYRSDGAVQGALPTRVSLPSNRAEASAAVAAAVADGLAVVPRGAGTGLSGGAAPAPDAVVVSLMKLESIGDVDVANRRVWVEPGVRNLDLSRHTRRYGLVFGPDPSSQSASTIGGNIATNAGGPRCYAVGSTTSHVIAVEVLLADGSIITCGDEYADPIGLDTRALVVGSEGTVGLVVRALVDLIPVADASRTVMCAFRSLEAAGEATAAIVRSGINATSIEMMDRFAIEICENFTGAGLPLEAEGLLLCEVEGLADTIDEEVAEFAAETERAGAYLVQVAESDEQAALWWRARKGAFGAVAQLASHYHLHDGVVPRTKLVEALEEVQEIGRRTDTLIRLIAHAGDGNLHPLIPYNGDDPTESKKVHEVSEEIMDVCLALGGAISGEHGIGSTKVHLMEKSFTDRELDYQRMVKCAFDPARVMNPTKVLPNPGSCGEGIVPPDSDMWI